MTDARNPTTRFSDRVENYVKHRPGYPKELLVFLRDEFGAGKGCQVADVGSGTGRSTEMLLAAGCEVYAVEPNADMRAAAEAACDSRPGFHSVGAPAEATTLPDASIDLVVAAQAFHWFDPAATRDEFSRILKPGGRVALIWNSRRDDTSFMRGYESLVRAHGIDYQEINHARVANAKALAAFFSPGIVSQREFDNATTHDFDGLLGRVLSCSYMPQPGHEKYEAMLAALRRLFDNEQKSGIVTMDYVTEVYYGKLPAREQ